MNSSLYIERRKHHRLGMSATAILYYEGIRVGHYVVEDLCAGGALLTGDAEIVEGEAVELWLQLPGVPPLEVEARVVRRSRPLVLDRSRPVGALAVEFLHQSADTEDSIHEALLGALDPDHRPSEPDLFMDDPESVAVFVS